MNFSFAQRALLSATLATTPIATRAQQAPVITPTFGEPAVVTGGYCKFYPQQQGPLQSVTVLTTQRRYIDRYDDKHTDVFVMEHGDGVLDFGANQKFLIIGTALVAPVNTTMDPDPYFDNIIVPVVDSLYGLERICLGKQRSGKTQNPNGPI